MTYTNFAKWDSYSLLKKKYANIELLKKVPTKLNWLIIIAIYLIEIISIIITVTYTSTNPIDTGISYIDITIKQLFMNNNTFFSIILAISLIFATTVGISAKKYMRSNKRYDMIIALTNMKKEKIMNIMLLDFILVSQSETLLLIVFAVIAFVSVRFNCIIGILVGILCLITVIELSYIVIICSYMWQNYKIKLCLSIVSFITTLKIGNYIASWIARFPLMKKIATEEEFVNWLDNGKLMLHNMFDYEKILEAINVKMLAFMVILFTLVILLLKNRIIYYIQESDNNTIKIRNIKSINYYERISVRKNMSAFNFVIQPLWWAKMGILLGIAGKANNAKVELFVGIFLAINMSFSFSKGMIEKNNKVLSLDGEGKKVIFWLDDLKALLEQKERIWIKSIVIVTIVQYILFVLATKKIEYTIFVLLQLTYMLLTYYMFTIPSVVVPHYEVENESELLMCADRQKMYDIIEFASMCMLNIIMELPCVLFITDYITKVNFYIMQFGIVILAIIIVSYMIRKRVVKEIKSKEYIRLIYK